MTPRITRRQLVRGVGGLSLSAAGLALLGACGSQSPPTRPAAGEAPPETTMLRLARIPAICFAPQYVAEELLGAEGFTDIQYPGAVDVNELLATGQADLTMQDPGGVLALVDAGQPVVVLAGIHGGCFELLGTGDVRALGDLKGKTVAVPVLNTGRHLFVASMAAYVGLDPTRDVNWVALPAAEAMELLAEGKVHAFLGFPPEPQELRARGIGHVMVNTAVDRPWSEHFCCYLVGNREFVARHPVATRRALRAILKAADLCAAEPERAARYSVEKGYTRNYEYTLQALREIPYARWRDYDSETTLRFFGLRLYEAGLLRNNPNSIIQRGTDWRFLNELKGELKG